MPSIKHQTDHMFEITNIKSTKQNDSMPDDWREPYVFSHRSRHSRGLRTKQTMLQVWQWHHKECSLWRKHSPLSLHRPFYVWKEPVAMIITTDFSLLSVAMNHRKHYNYYRSCLCCVADRYVLQSKGTDFTRYSQATAPFMNYIVRHPVIGSDAKRQCPSDLFDARDASWMAWKKSEVSCTPSFAAMALRPAGLIW